MSLQVNPYHITAQSKTKRNMVKLNSFVPIFLYYFVVNGDAVDNDVRNCNIGQDLINEINSYQATVDRIVEVITKGQYASSVYNELAEFVDTFGGRMAGTENLENAIDYMLKRSRTRKLDNVHGEDLLIPHWIRGYENATLLTPRMRNLPLTGLGYSVGTPPGGITADVIVVQSFKELDQNADKVTGKIVVFNQKFESYGQSVEYRVNGAARAAKHGAIAVLVRSVTAFSLRTPHTGMMAYDERWPKIPAACITVEDATLLQRLQARGYPLKIYLELQSELVPNKTTRNTIADITGSSMPSSVVLVSGHLDSWDLADGALDDGAGAFISWQALVVLKGMGLRPKRTLRAVLWTAEEIGLLGVKDYVQRHVVENSSENFNFVMESDSGTFEPKGLSYSGSYQGGCIVREILKLFKTLNATTFTSAAEVSSDITVFQKYGIPAGGLDTANGKYSWFHHTAADTLDVVDSATLDRVQAFWTAVSYVIADLSADIPRK